MNSRAIWEERGRVQISSASQRALPTSVDMHDLHAFCQHKSGCASKIQVFLPIYPS